MNFRKDNNINLDAYQKLKSLLRQLSGGGYSFIVSERSAKDCDVRVMSDGFCGAQQHVISMQCQNLTARQAQSLVSQFL